MNSEWPVDHVTYFWKRGPLSSIVTVCRICRHQKIARVSYSASFFLGCDFFHNGSGCFKGNPKICFPRGSTKNLGFCRHWQTQKRSSLIIHPSKINMKIQYIWSVLRKTSGGGRKGGGDGRRRAITLAELRHMVSAMLDRCRVDNVELS